MKVYSYDSLLVGFLIRRLNRFVAQVLVPDLSDKEVMCYLPNPGSMLGMCVKMAEVRMSTCHKSLKRKFQYTMEAILINGVWIGCNTHVANLIVGNLLCSRSLPLPSELMQYTSFKREVKAGGSRLDFMLQYSDTIRETHLEVKTVTMASDWHTIETNSMRASKSYSRLPVLPPPECEYISHVALFPDCESKRAQKHLLHLQEHAKTLNGSSVLVYIILRRDASAVGASKFCDPKYSRILSDAISEGVTCIPIVCDLRLTDHCDSHIYLSGVVPIQTEFKTEANSRTKKSRLST